MKTSCKFVLKGNVQVCCYYKKEITLSTARNYIFASVKEMLKEIQSTFTRKSAGGICYYPVRVKKPVIKK